MFLIYTIGIFLYSILIKLVSLFNNKARKRVSGIKKQKNDKPVGNNKKIIWFHCASVGEFEQARPLIEKIKETKPAYKILLTFFSASGYELRKNYPKADYVTYLPPDSKKNAKNIIETYQPDYVFWVKYEFWYNYLSELKKNNIKTFLISGIFRENQIFFKFYGNFYRDILKNFTTLFIQNQNSEKLLNSINIKNTAVVGDTRFDRVLDIFKTSKKINLIENFKQDKLLVIAGSTWFADEQIIVKFINSNRKNVKFIIVPHEISEEKISKLCNSISEKSILFSEANEKNIQEKNVLIIDNVGMLSSLYKYANIAYVGGGFGAGIHNTLEPAVCGIPVIFGKKYQNFDEAVGLIDSKAAFSICNYTEFKSVINKIINDKNFRDKTGLSAGNYVRNEAGASCKILKKVQIND